MVKLFLLIIDILIKRKKTHMQKLILTSITLIFALISNISYAQNSFFDKTPDTKTLGICLTGFNDYPPFGYKYYTQNVETLNEAQQKEYKRASLFDIIFVEFTKNANVITINDYTPSYQENIRLINSGKCDVILGAYFDTKSYQQASLIYPSLINNSVSLIMLPKTAKNIKNLSELKKLKGGIFAQDHFSDFVQRQMKDYELTKEEMPTKLFEKLFTGQIDYIFATHYFATIEAIKLGLRDQLSFSKQAIWDMPIFLGVSKASRNRKYLEEKLTSYSNNPENRAKIEQELRRIIAEFEAQYQGTVPPTYIKQAKENNPSTLPKQESEEKKEKQE